MSSSIVSAVAAERPYFFPKTHPQLFGVLHMPSHAMRGGVLLCHAFAEEKLWSHRVYVTFARELAALGYAVLRFDFRGEGDSDLEFEQATISTRIADVITAFEELRANLSSDATVTLVGHRLGGSIALAAAARLSVRADVVIWDPITDGQEYFQQLLRSNLTTQLATQGRVVRNRNDLIQDLLAGRMVVADGYGLSAELYRELAGLTLAGDLSSYRGRCLLIEIARAGQTEPSSGLLALRNICPDIAFAVAEEPPFWRETRQFHKRAQNLSVATIEWLQGAEG